MKNGKGAVQPGAAAADATLELSDADFLAMTSGKADAMKLYMGGKLKVAGDVMASQKLSFLQKIDPKEALEAIAKKRGGGTRAGAAAPPRPRRPLPRRSTALRSDPRTSSPPSRIMSPGTPSSSPRSARSSSSS